MKLEITFDDADPSQVANELARMLSLALQTGVDVGVNEDSYSVTNPGDRECVRRWVGPQGEYRRDILEKRWVVKESTDPSGKKLPPSAV
jgi:hypothetical protein